MAELIILDVGHGNCTIANEPSGTVVIDSPLRTGLLDTLAFLEITVIEAAFVSHADQDHVAGILALLTSDYIHVKRLYVNPDATKKTKIWGDLRAAAQLASETGTQVSSYTTSVPGRLGCGKIEIEIIRPNVEESLGGPGSASSGGGMHDSNSSSGVFRISYDGRSQALVAGDMNATTLRELRDRDQDISASILIFPHHGGLPRDKADPRKFATELCQTVNPDLVLFSNGRHAKFRNPRSEIVEGVLKAGKCAIACTQLSQECAGEITWGDLDHVVADIFSDGRNGLNCCAGTLRFSLESSGKGHLDQLRAHRAFIDGSVPDPLCRRIYS